MMEKLFIKLNKFRRITFQNSYPHNAYEYKASTHQDCFSCFEPLDIRKLLKPPYLASTSIIFLRSFMIMHVQ